MTNISVPTTGSPNAADDITFTGERFHISEHGQIRLEHMHRYVAACTLIEPQMTVLDIACGEGYGSALMSQYATQVIGVDIDPATVRHAQTQYAAVRSKAGNPIDYRVGNCAAIPVEDHSIDLLVSFETLEHHDQHEEMMAEVRRVLRPGGMLLLSSPNRTVYTEQVNHHNPFHVKELDHAELVTLVTSAFPYVRLLGQAIQMGSFLFPEQRSDRSVPLPDGTECDISPSLQLIDERTGETKSPAVDAAVQSARYYLVVAGEEEQRVILAADKLVSSFFDPKESALVRLEKAYNDVVAEARKQQEYIPKLENDFRRIEGELRSVLTEREVMVTERAAVVADRDRLLGVVAQMEAHPLFRLARRAGWIKGAGA